MSDFKRVLGRKAYTVVGKKKWTPQGWVYKYTYLDFTSKRAPKYNDHE